MTCLLTSPHHTTLQFKSSQLTSHPCADPSIVQQSIFAINFAATNHRNCCCCSSPHYAVRCRCVPVCFSVCLSVCPSFAVCEWVHAMRPLKLHSAKNGVCESECASRKAFFFSSKKLPRSPGCCGSGSITASASVLVIFYLVFFLLLLFFFLYFFFLCFPFGACALAEQQQTINSIA